MYDTLRLRAHVSAVLAVFTALALTLLFAAPVLARGGGCRGGGGGFRGGGGGRSFSSPSGGFSRPSMPTTRPSPGFMPGGPGMGPGQPGGPGFGPGQPGRPGFGPGQPGNRPPWHTGNNNINTGNINVNSNNGGWGYGWGSGAGLALGAAAATGAAIGSATSEPSYYGGEGYAAAPAPTVVYSLPPSCSTVVVNGATYQSCDGSYYQPVYNGATVVYQQVPSPY